MSENYYGSEQQAIDLHTTSQRLTEQLIDKEVSYKGSWQRRGGQGAFMMLARKADRVLPIIDLIKETWEVIEHQAQGENYDIWKVWDRCEQMCDSEMNDIEDLAGYLLHIINEMRIVRPRRLEEEYEQKRKSIVLPDGSVGANPEYPNEVRLTCSEWKELSEKGHIHLGDGSLLTSITKETLINDGFDSLNDAAARIGAAPASAAEASDRELPYEPSHPFNYPSAGNQCPQCNATSPQSTGNECTCRRCGHKFPKKDQGPSQYDQKFPQVMINRSKNQPETNTIVKG